MGHAQEAPVFATPSLSLPSHYIKTSCFDQTGPGSPHFPLLQTAFASNPSSSKTPQKIFMNNRHNSQQLTFDDLVIVLRIPLFCSRMTTHYIDVKTEALGAQESSTPSHSYSAQRQDWKQLAKSLDGLTVMERGRGHHSAHFWEVEPSWVSRKHQPLFCLLHFSYKSVSNSRQCPALLAYIYSLLVHPFNFP